MILGRVLDPSGAVVPGASVRAVNLNTNTGASTKTSAEGTFELPYLLTGTYRLEVERAGFKKFVRAPLELRAADRTTIDVVLQIGDTAETVTVTAESPLLETATASIGRVIDRRFHIDMPQTDGNTYYVLLLAPGIVNLQQPAILIHPGSESGLAANIVVDGVGSGRTEFTLDGQPIMARTGVAFTPPADIISEMKVETANYDASVGYAPGGKVNTVTKSGTNAFHGTLFEYNTSGPMYCTDFFANRVIYDPSTGPVTEQKKKFYHPRPIINRFGGTLAGPLLVPGVYNGRNRTFFSFGQQTFLRRSTSPQYLSVPDPRHLAGDFSNLLAISSQYQIYDPSTAVLLPNGRINRQPFAGNLIPKSRLNPMALAISSYYPGPTLVGTADGQNNFMGVAPDTNDYTGEILRLDHVFSERHRTFVNWTHYGVTVQASQLFKPSRVRGFYRGRYDDGFAFDDVLVFSPTVLMNIRANYTRYTNGSITQMQPFDITTLGFPKSLAAQLDPANMNFPVFSINGLTSLGESGANHQVSNFYTAAVNLTKTAGRHSVRFGSDYRLLRWNTASPGNVSPSLTFGTNWTRGPLDTSSGSPSGIGQGLASFLLGLPTSGSIDFNDTVAAFNHYVGFYFTDDWRLTPHLMLNLGLRYEYETPIIERHNRSVRDFDFIMPNPIDALAREAYKLAPIPQITPDRFRSIGGLRFAGVRGSPRELWHSDSNNLAPRVGITYSPTADWSFRLGYGIFYDRLGVDRQSAVLTGFNRTNNMTPTLDNGLTFVATLADPFPGTLPRPLGAAGGLSTNVGQSVSYFHEYPLNAYMQRWSVSIQKMLPSRTVFEVSYVGNRAAKVALSRQLDPIPREYYSTSPTRDQAVIDFFNTSVKNPYYPNLPGTSLASAVVSITQLLRPFPHFTGINTSFPAGSTWYHSLQVQAEKRFGQGYTFLASYTWSKLMEAASYLNDTDPRPEHVISSNDRPQRLAISGVYELPFGAGKRFLNSGSWVRYLVGGWQVQGMYMAQSGAPIGFGNIIFYGDLHDIPLPIRDRRPERWFNTDAGFEKSAAKQLANNIRIWPSRLTGVRSDGQNVWNLGVVKNIQVREGLRLQVRAEAQNALNHPHFGSPNTSPTSTLFGVVSSSNGQPRLPYIGLRMEW